MVLELVAGRYDGEIAEVVHRFGGPMGSWVGEGVALPGAAGGFADAEGFDDKGAGEKSVGGVGIEAESVIGVRERLLQFMRALFGDCERVTGGGEIAPVR